MKKRVLLIHPPDNKVSLSPGRFEPLGLEILAATIPRNEVKILDLRIDTRHTLDRCLDSFCPDIVGMTINNTIHVRQAKKVLAYIRNRNPEMTLVIGGHHVTMMPQDFHIPSVDTLFLGWAEKSFPSYIRSLENGLPLDTIDGIQVLKNGKLLLNNASRWDLNASEIAHPRRDLIKEYERKYRNDMGFKTALVNTTRGCANRCAFCGVWQVTGGRFLIRNPKDVFDEIAAVPSHVKRIFFADDNTFLNTAFAWKLCTLIKESGIKKKYHAYCRSDTIIRHPDLMRAWKEIGLVNLCVGFEGIDSHRLLLLNKKNTTQNNEKAADILCDIGIPFRPHFLIEPTFQKEDFDRLVHYVSAHNLKSPIFPILTPIPGTQYYREVKDNIILEYDFFDMAHSTIPTTLPPKEFYENWMKLYFRSYCFKKNLLFFVLRTIGKILGNKKLVKKYAHLSIVNLVMLKIKSLFLHFKIVRHYKYVENLKKSRDLLCPVWDQINDSSA